MDMALADIIKQKPSDGRRGDNAGRGTRLNFRGSGGAT